MTNTTLSPSLESQLLDLLIKIGNSELAKLSPVDANKARDDIDTGRIVMALYVDSQTARVKFNPDEKAVAACFP